jgi:catechol 2,3-dioxygenase-like lactoylglutathione lyase family enzyme
MTRSTACVLMLAAAGCASTGAPPAQPASNAEEPAVRLGAFSISLAVQDLAASRAFYEKLGFRAFAGDPAQNWLILQSGTSTVGLFQGQFERNIMTFNPGWDSSAQPVADFDDVREIQAHFKRMGLTLTVEADESSTGPAYLMLVDPDGNPILVDQHVPAPQR